jgi:protein-disulfide isomerase/uncharacterized membrane protein
MSAPVRGQTRILWPAAAAILIALGTGCCAYLLARHFAIAGTTFGTLDICQAIFGGDCDSAIRSELAVQFGIPLAGWGIVHFAMVATALLLAFRLGSTFVAAGTLAALALCIIAAGLGIILTAMMLTGIAAFCPLCVIVHVINVALVPVVFLAAGQPLRELTRSFRSGIGYLVGRDVQDRLLARWTLLGLVTTALVGIVAYQWILIEADRRAIGTKAPITLKEVLAEFDAGKVYEIPVTSDDPRLGDVTGPLRLVVFSDFQCPACQRFAQAVAHIRDHHPQLSIVFKHYPLGKECNSAIRVDLHPLSCGAACAAEAARRQGKFWEYHDALFSSEVELAADALRSIAERIGLDVARFDADLRDATTKAKVEADVQLGKKLQIVGTPTAFLNNRPLSSSAMSMFDQLIESKSGVHAAATH